MQTQGNQGYTDGNTGYGGYAPFVNLGHNPGMGFVGPMGNMGGFPGHNPGMGFMGPMGNMGGFSHPPMGFPGHHPGNMGGFSRLHMGFAGHNPGGFGGTNLGSGNNQGGTGYGGYAPYVSGLDGNNQGGTGYGGYAPYVSGLHGGIPFFEAGPFASDNARRQDAAAGSSSRVPKNHFVYFDNGKVGQQATPGKNDVVHNIYVHLDYADKKGKRASDCDNRDSASECDNKRGNFVVGGGVGSSSSHGGKPVIFG